MPAINPSLANEEPNAMFRIGALVHGREDIVHLEFGEPDWLTPGHIVEAAMRSLRDERQGYGPGAGLPELRAAITARVGRVGGFMPAPEQVIVGAGGTGALMASLLCLCTPGDEVLIPDPGWPGYDAMLAVAGARKVYYPLHAHQGWLPDLDALEAAITPHSRVLLINTPANPTGAVFPRETIAALVEIARRHDLWLLSDECYDEMLFEGTHISAATLDGEERVLTIGTCSKSYAMTGWRVGWVVTPPTLARPVTLAVTAQVNNLPLFTQRAAEAALTGPQECVATMRTSYQQRRDLAAELLREHSLLEFLPQGAFYQLVPLARAAGYADPAIFDSVTFAERLIAAKGIAVAPGRSFGEKAAGYARISFASSEEALRTGINRMLAFAATYRDGS